MLVTAIGQKEVTENAHPTHRDNMGSSPLGATLFSKRIWQHVQALLAGAFPQLRAEGP